MARACRFHQQQAGAVHQLVTSTEPLLLLDEFKLERIASAPTGETKLLVTFELSRPLGADAAPRPILRVACINHATGEHKHVVLPVSG